MNNCSDAIDVIIGNKNYFDEVKDKAVKSRDINVQSFTLAVDFVSSVGGVIANFKKVEIPYGWQWGQKVSDALDATGVIGGAVNILLDGLNAAQDLCEIYETYGKIQANYVEYQKYLELLRRIERHSPLDYVRGGAANITAMFYQADNDEPNWQKFNEKVNEAKNKVLLVAEVKMIWHAAIVIAGVSGFPWLGVADMAISTGISLLDQTTLFQKAHAIVYAKVYHSIFQAGSMLFTEAVSFHDGYFEAESGDKDNAVKYLVQMAQARIVGLDEVNEYQQSFKIDRLVKIVFEPLLHPTTAIIHIIEGIKDAIREAEVKAEIQAEYEQAISGVYEAVKNLQHEFREQLSLELPYYPDDYLK